MLYLGMIVLRGTLVEEHFLKLLALLSLAKWHDTTTFDSKKCHNFLVEAEQNQIKQKEGKKCKTPSTLQQQMLGMALHCKTF